MPKVENMSWEILDLITEEFYDDKSLVKDCLYYLYHTISDKKMKEQIEDWFKMNCYCLVCGNKLKTYQYDETHSELEYDNIEHCFVELCPLCDMPNNDIYSEVTNK